MTTLRCAVCWALTAALLVVGPPVLAAALAVVFGAE